MNFLPLLLYSVEICKCFFLEQVQVKEQVKEFFYVSSGGNLCDRTMRFNGRGTRAAKLNDL